MKTQPKYRVVGDLEANSLLDEATEIHCGVFKCIDTGRVKKFRPEDVHKIPEFLDKCSMLIMHNGISYDKPLMKKLLGYEYKGKLVDTLLMSRLLRSGLSKPKGCRAGPHSVEAYGIRYGHAKPENEDWSVFTEHMLHRCSEDVEIQHKIYKDLMTDMTPAWSKPMKLTHQFFEIMALQEQYGWKFDVDKCNHYIGVLTRRIERIDNAITPYLPMIMKKEYSVPLNKPFKKSGGYSQSYEHWYEKVSEQGYPYAKDTVAGPFSRVMFRRTSLDSGQEVKEFLLASGWQPKEYNFKKDSKGKPLKDDNGGLIFTSPILSADDGFEGVSGSVGRLLALRVQIRHRRSTLEGYLKNVRPDGRIPSVITGIAATRRLTHGKIVNVPNTEAYFGKQMRSLFICEEDKTLVSVDAANCQVRMEAARANSPEYTKMLLEGKKEDGTDNHSVCMKAVNSVLRNRGISEITRGKAKGFNFAKKFGAGDAKLGKMANGAAELGTSIKEAIARAFPAQDALVKRLTKEWKRNAKVSKNKWGKPQYRDGWITGLDGGPIKIESEHMVLVYALQSDESICLQYATCYLHKWLLQRGYQHGKEFGWVCNYHDEFTLEVDTDIAEEVKQLGEKAIRHAGEHLGLSVPQLGEGEIGRSWKEVH